MCSLPAWYRSQRWANQCWSQPGCYCQPVRGTQLGCAFQLGFQSACGHHSTSASAVREHHNVEPGQPSRLRHTLSDRRIRLLKSSEEKPVTALLFFFDISKRALRQYLLEERRTLKKAKLGRPAGALCRIAVYPWTIGCANSDKILVVR